MILGLMQQLAQVVFTLDRALSEGDEICMETSLIVTLLEIEKFSKVVKLVLEEQVCPLTDTLEVTF